jgi:hypothetical protein
VVHKDSAGSGWTVSDCHATANQKPELDASQDAKLLSMAFDAATRYADGTGGWKSRGRDGDGRQGGHQRGRGLDSEGRTLHATVPQAG